MEAGCPCEGVLLKLKYERNWKGLWKATVAQQDAQSAAAI